MKDRTPPGNKAPQFGLQLSQVKSGWTHFYEKYKALCAQHGYCIAGLDLCVQAYNNRYITGLKEIK